MADDVVVAANGSADNSRRTFSLLVYVCFMFVSVTSLLPWNLFQNAHEYFYYMLGNHSQADNGTRPPPNVQIPGALFSVAPLLWSESDLSPLQRSFEGWLTLVSNLSCLLGAIANAVATANSVSNGFRVSCGHAIIIVAFLPTIALTFIPLGSMSSVTFFALSLSLAALASFGAIGLLGGGCTALVALFPPIYIQSLMIGQALAGIMSSLLSIACQVWSTDAVRNGRLYFSLALGWAVASVGAYHLLVHSSFAKSIIFRRRANDGDRSPLVVQESEDDSDGDEYFDSSFDLTPHAIPAAPAELDDMSARERCLYVLRTTRYEMAAMALTLLVTLCVFPSVASQVRSTRNDSATWTAYFSSVGCFLAYNCGDMLGRLFARSSTIPGRWQLLIALLRLPVAFAIALCPVEPRFHTHTHIHSDGAFVALILAFSISSGYLQTVSMIGAARLVPIELGELCGSLVACVGVLSALCGSALGLVVLALL